MDGGWKAAAVQFGITELTKYLHFRTQLNGIYIRQNKYSFLVGRYTE
jgi:hypothetical protein